METLKPIGVGRAAESHLLIRFASVILFMAGLTVGGCGGDSGDSIAETPAPLPTQETGKLTVTITDAEGDFVTYTVDVV